MSSDFISRLKQNKYISKNLYNKTDLTTIPANFDLNSYNDNVLEELYKKYKSYFDNMYKGIDESIHLDKEQIKAILADEDYSLILAGAGTGKTTTMASKVKYLVDIKKINPENILVLSYTSKATEELINRINYDFNIPAKVMTFHSLGYRYIREIFKTHKCYVVDENKRQEIFLEFFEYIYQDKSVLDGVLKAFTPELTCQRWIFADYLKENYKKYDTYQDLFDSYKEYKISQINNLSEFIELRLEYELNQEVIRTIKNELVKSKGEAIIANYLFTHNITYTYEKPYPKLVKSNKLYRPDFTIDYDGTLLYIEYFGLSKDKQNKKYQKEIEIKLKFHKQQNTNFIKINYGTSKEIIDTLEKELKRYGIPVSKKSDEEIYNAMLDRNKLSLIYPLKNLFYGAIEYIKSNQNRKSYKEICLRYISTLNEKEKLYAKWQLELFDKFYKFYQAKLYQDPNNYGFDFPDMIYYAKMYMNKVNANELNFKYIIIDEYQDISQERYELTKQIASKNTSKVVAVGDDWQSIYAFNGSKIEYIYNFTKYFPNSKLFKISQTYRNSQDLIGYTGDFIMRNKAQIPKKLISNKRVDNPIRFCMFDDYNEYEVLKRLILKIHGENPEHSILILGRTNKIINQCFNDPDLIDSVSTKVIFRGYDDIDIDAMTIHKSKGLTSDEVILIGLDRNYPSNLHNQFWISSLFRNEVGKESIDYPEERRLFYVALTRTKNHVYLLTDRNIKNRSPFVNEIYQIIMKDKGKNIER